MWGAEKAGLGELLGRLAGDARAVARAEIRVAKQKAFDRLKRARTALILLGLAIVIVQAAMTALFMALVIGLATIVGPVAAGGILFVIVIVIAGILGLVAGRLLAAQRPKPLDEEETP